MSGEETVQIPASLLEKMQAQIAALSEKVGLQEDEIIDPNWPVTVYRQNPQAEVEEHDHVNWKASFEAKSVADQTALDAAVADGWSKDVPKSWLASYVPPKAPKVVAQSYVMPNPPPSSPPPNPPIPVPPARKNP